MATWQLTIIDMEGDIKTSELKILISMIRAIIWKWKEHGLITNLPLKEHLYKVSEQVAGFICQNVMHKSFTT